jgi:uncharacterized protein (DUF934 family)
MPRQLLRDHRIVADEWRYVSQGEDGGVNVPVLIEFLEWQSERSAWIARGGPLGVILSGEHKVEQLAPDLAHLSLVACRFGGPAEGRGYTQARQLREQHGFGGELRAIGYVRTDQLFFLARCGFNSFELPEADLGPGLSAFNTFSRAYQPSNDRGLGAPLTR